MARNKKKSSTKAGGDSEAASDASKTKASNTPGRPTSFFDTDAAISSLFAQLPSLSRIMSVVMLIFGIVTVGILFYRVMAVFFVPLFMAAALVVIFHPVFEWLVKRFGNRPRTAAVATTLLILLMVLMPILALLSVAATQFTAMVSQADFNDLTDAVDRARNQFGLSLEHPEQFRRLDQLADSLDSPETSKQALAEIAESKELLTYLQADVAGPITAEAKADFAQERLNEFAAAVTASEENLESKTLQSLVDDKDLFHRQGVVASASIRAWMHSKLGGSFRSQLRLLANPSESEFASLLRRSRESLQPRFVKLTSATGTILLKSGIGLVILIISAYFFLVDGPAMIRTLMRLSPLDDNYERRLLLEFDKTSRAVVLASIASAVAQGLLAAIAFYFCGLQSIVLLFLITCLMALIPFLGAASVWIPCAIYVGAVDQRWGVAAFLAIYGALVVSSIDNVIKAYVLQGHSQIHPLLALLSVLGGIQVFGPIGILVGPMVVVFLQTLLEILNHELGTGSAVDTETDNAPV
ncbi:AI-2E family transporter [Planctomycetes bacterium K23_9]|uniref:Putative inner membrane protein n=1 Tax=Stieleria marina TaxID=1930275 RepID=A0A517NSV2_9BACT|nr:putative inner membrane protein [Planctomycetes bacterium K23_9]